MDDMNYNDYISLILGPNSKLSEALQILNATGQQIILVCSDQRKLLGTVTDGDIRRALLKGETLDSQLDQVMNTNPLTTPIDIDEKSAKNIMRSKHIRQLPVVTTDKVLLGLKILTLAEVNSDTHATMVIMAGGKGRRLHPFTENCPKPLVKVGGKPIIQHIIETARDSGIKNIFVSLNHFAEQLEEFLQDGSKFDVNLTTFQEAQPLGTAGALGLIQEKLPNNFLVSNGDIITNLDYRKMLMRHERRKVNATMAVRQYIVENQFGVVNVNGSKLVGFSEKPQYHSTINAGVYCLSSSMLDLLNIGEPCDMPTLFMRAKAANYEVEVFQMYEDWIDIGNPVDLKLANAHTLANRKQR